MINLQDRQLVYEFLTLDITIRAIQHDIEHMQQLKYAELYVAQLSNILESLQRDYQWRRKRLMSKKIRLSKWIKVDEFFSDAILATAGEDESLRFSVHALKQNSRLLVEQRLMPVILISKENKNIEET